MSTVVGSRGYGAVDLLFRQTMNDPEHARTGTGAVGGSSQSAPPPDAEAGAVRPLRQNSS